MKMTFQFSREVLFGLSIAVALAACNSSAQPQAEVAAAAAPAPERVVHEHTYERQAAPVAVCNDCGTITSVEQMKSKGTGSGIGAVAGAVVGAVAGHQVGGGRGKDAATVVGAIGGGFAGNEIEKRVKGTIYYHVTVAMHDGSSRSVDVDALNGLGTGSKVKVSGNNLQSAG